MGGPLSLAALGCNAQTSEWYTRGSHTTQQLHSCAHTPRIKNMSTQTHRFTAASPTSSERRAQPRRLQWTPNVLYPHDRTPFSPRKELSANL